MDSSNLSLILAPNLLHFGEATEKMNANTEKRLKLHAAIVHCFIENAHNFGMTLDIFSYICASVSTGAFYLYTAVFVCLRCVTTVSPRENSRHDGLWGGGSVPYTWWTRRAGCKLRVEEEA